MRTLSLLPSSKRRLCGLKSAHSAASARTSRALTNLSMDTEKKDVEVAQPSNKEDKELSLGGLFVTFVIAVIFCVGVFNFVPFVARGIGHVLFDGREALQKVGEINDRVYELEKRATTAATISLWAGNKATVQVKEYKDAVRYSLCTPVLPK